VIIQLVNLKRPKRAKTIRVLHVDDDPAILEVFKEILSIEKDMKIDTATSVDEAFSKIDKISYDAIICDYEMPKKDGLTFLEELRNNNNTIPFFILTGKSHEDVAIKALNLGANRYFEKTSISKIFYPELIFSIRQAIEKKRTEIELVRRELKLGQVLETPKIAILISSLDGKMRECNKEARILIGATSEKEIIGKNFFTLIANDNKREKLKIIKKINSTMRLPETEYVFHTLSGLELIGNLSINVVSNELGTPDYLVIRVRDITKQKKMENDLKRLASIATASSEAIIVMNTNGQISDWNYSAERLYGYTKNEASEMNILDIIPEQHKQQMLMVFEKTKKNLNVTNFESQRLTKDGRLLDISVKITLLEKTERKVVSFATTEFDITERKIFEEKLRSSEKLVILGQITSSVAHEVRNPLGVISNSLYYLNLKLKDTSDIKIEKHLKIIDRNISVMEHIISDLLEVGRNKNANLESTNLETILESTVAEIIIPENIKIIKKINKNPKIQVDPDHIKRLFLNIIQNAFAAMPQGGKLTIQLSTSNNYLEISFQDSGEGISKENLQKIFTPLFTTKAKGLGLGLIICKQIVDTYKGEMKISSNVNQGTLVIIRLPLPAEVPIDAALQLEENINEVKI
jgi:PAS domain S-box-containing protein